MVVKNWLYVSICSVWVQTDWDKSSWPFSLTNWKVFSSKTLKTINYNEMEQDCDFKMICLSLKTLPTDYKFSAQTPKIPLLMVSKSLKLDKNKRFECRFREYLCSEKSDRVNTNISGILITFLFCQYKKISKYCWKFPF